MTRRTHASSLLPILLLALAACELGGTPELRGSGNPAEETREVADFTEIEMSVPGTLEISPGEAGSLRLTADDNLIERIETTVEGGTLRITSPGVQPRPSSPLRVHLTVRELRSVTGTGAATITLEGMRGEALAINLTGAGRVRGSGFELERLSLSLSGAAGATLAGSARELALEVTGAGEVNASNLEVARARVQLVGAASARVNASEHLSGSAVGASSLTYHGEPVLEVTTAGASRVRRAN
jgi:hypothetical protein